MAQIQFFRGQPAYDPIGLVGSANPQLQSFTSTRIVLTDNSPDVTVIYTGYNFERNYYSGGLTGMMTGFEIRSAGQSLLQVSGIDYPTSYLGPTLFARESWLVIGSSENDRFDTGGYDDIYQMNAGDDYANGLGGNDQLFGGSGADTLIGGTGDDLLDGGSNPDARGDVLLGGSGDDTYLVDSGLDFVDEGNFAEYASYGAGGTDTIVSTADFFWDVYSVGETVQVSEDVVDAGGDGVTIVGGVFDNTLIGHSGTDVLFGRGGSDIYKSGDGVDFMSLSTLGVANSGSYVANGVNTVVVEQRTTGPNSYDIVFEFESGRDKLDVSDYGFASTATAFATGVNDGAGNSYFILGDGLDYLYMVGLELADLRAGDFVV